MQYPIVYGMQGAWATLHPNATTDQTIFINISHLYHKHTRGLGKP